MPAYKRYKNNRKYLGLGATRFFVLAGAFVFQMIRKPFILQ
jgi:hypothetical protein